MASAVGANVGGSPLNFMEKYQDERDKRLRAEGTKQYIDLERSDKFRGFLEDPWAPSAPTAGNPISDGRHTKVLIVGAGFGGVIFAVRLIQAGFKPEDLVIVDSAAGFGGTWYWNRYPGLMCDIESYVYLPFLEEMGYMPKRRYASGNEIREYIESICTKYKLHERTMFRTSGKSMAWDDAKHQWTVKLSRSEEGGRSRTLSISADFAVIAPGLLHKAKVPDIEGIDTFKGHSFHTSRWDYEYTGGSPEQPELTKLRGKKVAIIGTGATAVQCVPQLAKYAKELYVFQRTPSSIDVRDNHDTDPDAWKNSIATKEGWQRERQLNFQAFMNNLDPKPEVNMVDDGWSNAPAYSALMGGNKPVTMETVAQHIGELHALDYPRTERIRQRAAEIVQDPQTAASLQAWYPTWCKRPCFHDEYLQAFNLPSVTLVDTQGAGIDRVTQKGIQFKGKEYGFDLIVWSTGFRSPALGTAAGKADMEVVGRHGKSMEQVNNEGGLLTLHGIASNGFPNVFWSGPMQAGAAANNTFTIDVLATHAAYVMAEAAKRTTNAGAKAVVEPTTEAQDAWAMQILMGAATFAAISGCTPSYINAESERDRLPQEQQMAAAKFSPWPHGFANFLEVIEKWRAKGDMEGMSVTVAS